MQDLIKDLIFYVERLERIHGKPEAPSEEAIAKARTEILEYLSFGGEILKDKIQATLQKSGNDFETAFITDYEDSPSLCGLFADEVRNSFMSEETQKTFFYAEFDQMNFVRGLVEDICKE